MKMINLTFSTDSVIFAGLYFLMIAASSFFYWIKGRDHGVQMVLLKLKQNHPEMFDEFINELKIEVSKENEH